MYKLSQTIAAHNGIVRSLSLHGDCLLTASSDKLAKLFELKGDHYQQATVLSFFENYIYATCARVGGGYAIGHDKDIYLIDDEGNPLGTLSGHDQQVCSLKSITNNILLSGSWDATAIVWDIASMKLLYRLVGHKYGVAVHGDENLTFVTGSQDGILHLWNKNTQIKQTQAHSDIIREIQPINIGYVTCSNDETIKIWTGDLENIQTLIGHKSFIFTLKLFDDFIISGGDDRQVILWSVNGDMKQNIQLPDTVWTLAINSKKDIVVGTSDGKVRVFTTDQKRYAPQEEIEALEQQSSLTNAQQEGGMSQDEINKLPGIEKIQTMKGKKEGEIRIFNNGNKPEAYMWSAATQNWQLIGDVIGGKGQSKAKKQFPGDMYFEAGEYDHIFDVEDDTGASKLLPYNEGESFYQTAEKFCLREGYSKHYLQQVINFLKKNTRFGQQSSKPPESELDKMKKQFAQQQEQIKAQKQIEFQFIPFTQCFYYDSKNLQGLSKKLFELNVQIVGDLQLTEKERLIFNKGLECLELSQTMQGVNVENSVSLIFLNKLLKWELQNLLPIYDFFRIFCLHHSSEQLFSGLDKGMNLFLGILTLVNNNQANPVLIRLALQTLCNCLKHNTNACAIMYHLNIVQEIILSQLSADEKTVPVIANLILNLSIGIYQRQGLNDQASRLLSEAVIQFLQFAERDVQTVAKLTTALGNLMRSPASQVRDQCKEICSDYILKLHIQTDNEATIKCLEEVKLSMQI